MGCMTLKSLLFVCFWVTSITEMTVLIQSLVLQFPLTWYPLTLSMKKYQNPSANCPVLCPSTPTSLRTRPGASLWGSDYSLPVLLPRTPHVRNTWRAHAIIPNSSSNYHGLSQSSDRQSEWIWRNHLLGHFGWHVQRWQPVYVFIPLNRAWACYFLAKHFLWFPNNERMKTLSYGMRGSLQCELSLPFLIL